MSTFVTSCTNNVCVPVFQKMDQFVTWNSREVKQLNPLAIVSAPFALLAQLINKIALPFLSSALLKHTNTSDALKLKVAQHLALRLPNYDDIESLAIPDANAEIAALRTADINKILNHLPIATLNAVDQEIYNLSSEDVIANDYVFGQHFREAQAHHPVVKAALLHVLQAS